MYRCIPKQIAFDRYQKIGVLSPRTPKTRVFLLSKHPAEKFKTLSPHSSTDWGLGVRDCSLGLGLGIRGVGSRLKMNPTYTN